MDPIKVQIEPPAYTSGIIKAILALPVVILAMVGCAVVVMVCSGCALAAALVALIAGTWPY